MTDVSVLTPSYGYGRFIADSIESVLRQDGLTIEHIIQDGASQDETLDVLRSFEGRVHWTSEPDQGQSDALNRALTKASGRWVAWLNADEYYLPGGLKALVDEAERSGADVIFGDAVEVNEGGRLLQLRPEHPFASTILRNYGPYPNTVSLIVRRALLDETPWDPTLKVVMDWDLYLGLLRKGASFRHVPYPVGAYRRHEGQASAGPGSRETTIVRQRYGIPLHRFNRRSGRALHRLYKLFALAYVRQLRARPLLGREFRWFDRENGAETFSLLLERCYKRYARTGPA
jgi:Glycosyl transferase family 2